jgi:hypothetical protein
MFKSLQDGGNSCWYPQSLFQLFKTIFCLVCAMLIGYLLSSQTTEINVCQKKVKVGRGQYIKCIEGFTT